MNIEEIVYKLESGGRLHKPVLFETPDCLKTLGERMYLCDYPHEAEAKINYGKTFACTWEQLKELAEAAVNNKPEVIQAIMLMNVFKGKEIKEEEHEPAEVRQDNEVDKQR